MGGDLPIKGGWGYTFDDAVIIDKNDSVVPKVPFNGIGYENIFVEKRIYEELIIFRPENERYSGIKWNLLGQKLINRNDRQYDVLTFEVTALPIKTGKNSRPKGRASTGIIPLNLMLMHT